MAKEISRSDARMLACDLIEAFEDFLDEKGIQLENEEKAEAIRAGYDAESICNIYGTDYGNLEETIIAVLATWKLVAERR